MPTLTFSPRFDEPRPIALANTIWSDRTGVHDAFTDSADTQHWIRAIGERMDLIPAHGETEVSAAAETALVDLRDAVRRLAADHTGDPRSLGQSPVSDQRSAIGIINRSAAMSSVWPELTFDRTTPGRRDVWVGDSYVDAVITVIARETIDLIVGPQWQQLRPCVAPGCAYYFVKDHFRREWCSAVCGNRARVARHAQRQRR